MKIHCSTACSGRRAIQCFSFCRGCCGEIVTASLFFLLTFTVAPLSADDALPIGWRETSVLAAPEARQAAAAAGEFVYAIDNKQVAKYDRRTGERVAVSTGDAHHLNSGFVSGVMMFCAHSNYPARPERSEIKVLDLETMELSDFKVFQDPPGSLTVALKRDGQWWCVFAHYDAEKSRTALLRYDDEWRVTGSWSFPESVLSDLGKYAISGAVWQDDVLLATGHDHQVIYRLQVPEQGTVLKHLGTVAAPFTGQGIAADPLTGGLIGINRAKKQVIFAEKVQP